VIITSSLPKEATFFRLNTLETYDCNRDKTTPNIFLFVQTESNGIYPSHPQLFSRFYHFPKACTLSMTVIELNRAGLCLFELGSNLAKNSKRVKLELKKFNLDMPFPSQGSSMGAMFSQNKKRKVLLYKTIGSICNMKSN